MSIGGHSLPIIRTSGPTRFESRFEASICLAAGSVRSHSWLTAWPAGSSASRQQSMQWRKITGVRVTSSTQENHRIIICHTAGQSVSSQSWFEGSKNHRTEMKKNLGPSCVEFLALAVLGSRKNKNNDRWWGAINNNKNAPTSASLSTLKKTSFLFFFLSCLPPPSQYRVLYHAAAVIEVNLQLGQLVDVRCSTNGVHLRVEMGLIAMLWECKSDLKIVYGRFPLSSHEKLPTYSQGRSLISHFQPRFLT